MKTSEPNVRPWRWVLSAACAALCAASCTAGLSADAPEAKAEAKAEDRVNPHLWKSRVTTVAVFKNGLGFFLREGKVALRKGWCASKEIPPAAFGTLAIFSHEKGQVVDIVGSGRGEVVAFDGEDAPKTLAAKRARLEASKDLKVNLTYKKGSEKLSAAGKLVSVGPTFVILQAEVNNFAVPLADVTRMQLLDLPVRVHIQADGEKAPEKTTLGMAYLRKGITWIPEYTLRIQDQDTAEITLRGTLVNEAEDLIHCDVNFVVGVPHFVHTDYMAPIAVGQVIRTIGARVAPVQVRGQMANSAAMFRNDRRSERLLDRAVAGTDRALRNALGNLPQMATAAGSDYTVYTKKDLTVRRGEKAIVTLFTRKIKYSHVYRWSPPAGMRHLLVLHNSTDTAWTTGPALVIDRDSPLSEDLLKYVPKGGAGEIPVTTAINVAHRKVEVESTRKLKAHSPAHDYFLDLVVLKGTLTLKNFEKRPTSLIVTVPVPGKPLTAGDDGQLRVNTDKLRLLERAGSVRWEIELKPDERKELTYTYERYVPSR